MQTKIKAIVTDDGSTFAQLRSQKLFAVNMNNS